MVCDDVVKDTNKQSYPGLSLFGKGSNVMSWCLWLSHKHTMREISRYIYLIGWYFS